MNEVNKCINSLNINHNDNVVVAVSGGPDSMCLLNLLIENRKEKNFNIICAHVNHSKREQSNDEKVYVEYFCKCNNIIFEYLKIEKYDESINFHKQARNIRYNFFEQVLKKYNSKYLFLAHHGDDLIETILMKITRGSNSKGYSGFRDIQNRNGYNIIRPLIYVTKEEVLKYLENNNIKYYIDDSNFKEIYTRNRYRKNILPFLKQENKNIHKKYIEFSNCIYEQEKFIEKIANQKYMDVVVNDVMNINRFILEDKIIQERITYLMLLEIYGSEITLITKQHIKLLIELINNQKPNISIDLPNNFIAIKEYNNFYIIKKSDQLLNYKYTLNNEINIDKYTIKIVKDSDDISNYTVRLNSEEIEFPLYIRNRKDGDVIAVKNLNGIKKVKDIMIDCKIPKNIRDTVPILVDSCGKIICIFGIKKSKYDKQLNEFYDIIVKCTKNKEEIYEK